MAAVKKGTIVDSLLKVCRSAVTTRVLDLQR